MLSGAENCVEGLDIEDATHGIPHLFHHGANRACHFIGTILAGFVTGHANATHGREGAIDGANDAAQRKTGDFPY